jgi:Holliday junction resolvasome RuvABC endonuclease subunit
VIGLDLSLAGTGVVVWDGHQVLRWRLPATSPSDGLDEHRIRIIWREVRRTCRKFPPDLVVMEEYAFSRHSRSISKLHELGGVIKQWLHCREILFISRPSTTIKLFATGFGKASKDDMVEAALPFFSEITDIPKNVAHNVADALHCARWGYENFTELTEEDG